MLAYIHIPYCDSKCHYCSFNSYTDKFDTRKRYIEALLRQLRYELERFEATEGSIETLFVGGGTPSTIAPELYAPLFALLSPYLQEGAEITMEANPNSATKAWLEGIYKLGVNRLSFGVQSFDPHKLKALGRAHSPRQAIEAITYAKSVGFEHLSLDLIYNYQGDTQALLGSDIDQAFALPIDHLSAYELTIEANTPFAHTPQVQQEDEALAFFVAEQITQRGFTHYEISNFGRYQSLHNQGYWELKPYIGAGAGAVGFLTNQRYYPQQDIGGYIADSLKIAVESLSPEALRTERLFLGLRSRLGVPKHILTDSMRERATLLCDEGKLTETPTHYYNPNFFLSDALAVYILE